MASGARIPWCAVALGIASIVSGVRGFARGEAAEEAPGRAVFVAKGCALCHEERAVLQAPHVSALRKDRSLFELATGLWNHAPMMWANLSEPGLRWPRLTSREVADLARYLNGAAPPDPPPNLARGQLSLLEKGCLGCHTVAGRGQKQGKDLTRLARHDSDEAWVAALWNHAPTMLALHAERRMAYPTFRENELADVVGFLRRPSPPR